MRNQFLLYVLMSTLAVPMAAQDIWQPVAGTTWWWQLEDASELNTDINVAVYDIDLFEGAEFNKIRELQDKGKKVICYFSAGTYEPYRADKKLFDKKSFLNRVGGFERERWLNIKEGAGYLPNIKKIMKIRMQKAKECGCDAVEPDNVDAWDNTNGKVSASDQLAYNIWIANTAHELGLSVGLKNDMAQVAELVDHFDFAVNEQCYAYKECEAYAETFLSQNKAVFNQEYFDAQDREGVLTASQYEVACQFFEQNKIASLWKKGYNLNGKGVIDCQDKAGDAKKK